MLRSLYTAATGMDAQQTKMDVISHNLANAGTTGFKRVRAEFEDLLADRVRTAQAATPEGGNSPVPLEVGLGVKTGGTTREFSQGDMLNTQNPLDVAIEGSGFLRVRRGDGEIAYTRAGNLRVDSEGRLVTQDGDALDDNIQLPQEATTLNIAQNGEVTATVPGRTEPVPVGALTLTVFTNPGGLESIGHNLLRATAGSGEGEQLKPGENGAGALSQGYLEGSNVKAVEEMVAMISTQRAYELNSKVIQTADQMLQKLTNLR